MPDDEVSQESFLVESGLQTDGLLTFRNIVFEEADIVVTDPTEQEMDIDIDCDSDANTCQVIIEGEMRVSIGCIPLISSLIQK